MNEFREILEPCNTAETEPTTPTTRIVIDFKFSFGTENRTRDSVRNFENDLSA